MFKLKPIGGSFNDTSMNQTKNLNYQKVYFLTEKIALEDEKEAQSNTSIAKDNKASPAVGRSDSIMFLKVENIGGRTQYQKSSIEIIYYSACFDHSLNTLRKTRQGLLKKLKQIEDRIRVKLILMQADE